MTDHPLVGSYLASWRRASSAVVESKEIVVAVVSCGTAHYQVECLGELHWLLHVAIDDKVTTDKRDDAIVESWLSVEGDDLVLDAGHAREFAHNVLHAEELFALVGQHRHFGVEGLKSCAI